MSTDNSLLSCIWNPRDSTSLYVLSSPFTGPAPIIPAGGWTFGEEGSWTFLYSFLEDGVPNLGGMVKKEEEMEMLSSLKIELSPLCFCQVKGEVWVGGKNGGIVTLPLLGDDKNEKGREIKRWEAHQRREVNGLVVVKGVGGVHNVWSCGEDGCIFVWKEGGRGLITVLEHHERRGIQAMEFCGGVVCFHFILLSLSKLFLTDSFIGLCLKHC